MANILYKKLSDDVIGASIKVHKILGSGLLEKIYRKSLVIELRLQGYEVHEEKAYEVHYRKQSVGFYMADIVVNDKIIVETKAVNCLSPTHESQLINYLRISKLRVGYSRSTLLNLVFSGTDLSANSGREGVRLPLFLINKPKNHPQILLKSRLSKLNPEGFYRLNR